MRYVIRRRSDGKYFRNTSRHPESESQWTDSPLKCKFYVIRPSYTMSRCRVPWKYHQHITCDMPWKERKPLLEKLWNEWYEVVEVQVSIKVKE